MTPIQPIQFVEFLGANDTKICGPGMIRCYRDAEKHLFGQDIIDGLTDPTAIAFRKKCNCMSGCASIKYEADVDRAKFNFEEILDAPPNSTTDTVILSLYFLVKFIVLVSHR